METFIEYFDRFVTEQLSLVECGEKTYSTWKTYYSRRNNYRQFLIDSHQLHLTPKDIKVRHLKEFDLWLRTEKKHANDVVMRHIQLIKTILDIAIEDEVIDYNVVRHYKFKYERKKRRIYLNLNQLTRLKTYPLPNDDLTRNRDMFLFSCYTGLSYCEISSFQKSNVIRGKDGTEWIEIIRKKTIRTGRECILPLLSGALEILKKYGYDLPVSSNARMNKSLKRISKITGIDIPISTHSGRKSFGNILVNDFGIDVLTVSEMMGHKDIKTTMDWYVDVRQEKITRDMRPARINW